MYSKTNKIFSSISGLENYIDGCDVYNSKLLLLLNNPGIEKESYMILNYQYRPDLIAKDFYGDTSYEGLLVLQLAMPLSEYKTGTVLHLIPKSTLESILNSL